METNFRKKLKRKETLLGTIVTLPNPEVAEILANIGFDWLFLDMEHAPLSLRETQTLLQAAGPKCAGIIRVPLNDEIWIKRALDLGPAGILVPQVNTCEEAIQAVRYSKYPLQGSRSVGVARAQGYGADLASYLGRANEEVALIVQVEHIESVHHVDEIINVEGIDAIFVGPYDLSASMGKIGQVTDPEVQTAIAQVRETCQAHRMPMGIFAATSEAAQPFIDEGYNLVAVGIDTLFLASAAGQALHQLRA